jgi:hypothetical protein
MPPGSATPEEQFRLIDKRFDDLSRRRAVLPTVQVQLTGAVSLFPGDTLAGPNWAAADDAMNMFTAANPCYITVSVRGWYAVFFHAAMAGTPGDEVAVKVTRNMVSVGGAIATDATTITPGGDGGVCSANRPRIYLNAGDVLYWSMYGASPCTLRPSGFSVPTEVTLRYIGGT